MELLTQNSKIVKSSVRTFNFGLPAIVTCPNAGACKRGCYANAGAYLFSNVQACFQARLEATYRPDFINNVCQEIDKKRAERVRIHDSGDFYSSRYLWLWIEIMRKCPSVQFYAYTKMVSMLGSLGPCTPDNFTYLFSFGGTEDCLINRRTDRHCIVFPMLAALKKAGYVDGSKTDNAAANPKVRKLGIVYHGTKNLVNTDWNSVDILTKR